MQLLQPRLERVYNESYNYPKQSLTGLLGCATNVSTKEVILTEKSK